MEAYSTSYFELFRREAFFIDKAEGPGSNLDPGIVRRGRP